MTPIPYYTLPNGLPIPALGFGTYKARGQQAIDTIKTALSEGYRLIDTAAMYDNEKEIGEAIRQTDVDREDVFITTKVWRDELGYDLTRKAFDKSLQNLGTEHIDLYLIHWPAHTGMYSNWQQVNADTWKALEAIHQEGRAKAIGVCNFMVHHLEALLQSVTVMPMLNQIEFHAGYHQPETVAFCQSNNIQLEAWSPIARGKILDDPYLNELAVKYSKTPAQVALRWIVQQQIIPIPKSATPQRIRLNLEVFDFELEAGEMDRINSMDPKGFSGTHPDGW